MGGVLKWAQLHMVSVRVWVNCLLFSQSFKWFWTSSINGTGSFTGAHSRLLPKLARLFTLIFVFSSPPDNIKENKKGVMGALVPLPSLCIVRSKTKLGPAWWKVLSGCWDITPHITAAPSYCCCSTMPPRAGFINQPVTSIPYDVFDISQVIFHFLLPQGKQRNIKGYFSSFLVRLRLLYEKNT